MTPTLVRLEYLGPDGKWTAGHHGVSLLDPQRYVDKVSERGKFCRAIELDDQLQPLGQMWLPF